MSHLYPLAKTAAEALADAELPAARIRADAEHLAGETLVESLETEWLTPEPEEREALLARADKGLETGFVQRYEDANGAPVLAVTYWKLGALKAKTKTKAAKSKPAPKTPVEEPAAPADDHTDDLYFRSGRTKKRKSKIDPNQMDLFGAPKDKAP